MPAAAAKPSIPAFSPSGRMSDHGPLLYKRAGETYFLDASSVVFTTVGVVGRWSTSLGLNYTACEAVWSWTNH